MFKMHNYVMKSGRRRHGFTLADLLAIFVLTLFFLVISLPVIKSAGENSEKIACMKNLKLIGAAIEKYVLDNDNYYPPTNVNPEEPSYVASIAWHEVLIQGEYGVKWDSFLCESMRKYTLEQGRDERSSVPRTSYYRKFSHYGLNRKIGGWPGNIYNRRKTSVSKGDLTNPSETILSTDTWSVGGNRPFFLLSPSYTKSNYQGVAWPVHESGVNTLWADGHVSYVKSPDSEDFSRIYEVLDEYYWKVVK